MFIFYSLFALIMYFSAVTVYIIYYIGVPSFKATERSVLPYQRSSQELNKAEVKSSETLKLLRKKLANATTTRELFNQLWIYLVDSGGQPQFTDVLPLLFNSEVLYIVVIRLDQALDEKQRSCYCHHGTLYDLPDEVALTNRELVERTCQVARSRGSENLEKMVFVIGTRYDKLKSPQTKVAEIDDQLLLLHEAYEDVLVPYDFNNKKVIFPINAMATGDERTKYTEELQNRLINLIEPLVKQVEVPLRWFIYQLDLEEEGNKSCGVVLKSTCLKLGEELEMIEIQVDECLKFFHNLAVIFYSGIPDKVLVRMDPLSERLSYLIKSSFLYVPNMPTFKFSQLKLTGLFHKSILPSVFPEVLKSNKEFSDEDFLQTLEYLKVIVSDNEDGEYFIPSALSVNKPEINFDTSIVAMFHWKRNILLPPGFFNTLIIKLRNNKTGQCYFSFPEYSLSYQSRDRITFQVSLGGFLVLDNHHNTIAIHSSLISADYAVALEIIYLILNNIVKEFCTRFLPFELGFLCQICGDNKHHPCSLTRNFTHLVCSLYPGKCPLPIKGEINTIINHLKGGKPFTKLL